MSIDDIIDDEDKPTVMMDCNRHHYERLYKQTTICGVPERKCLYMDKEPNKNNMYRCMNITRISLWRYEK